MITRKITNSHSAINCIKPVHNLKHKSSIKAFSCLGKIRTLFLPINNQLTKNTAQQFLAWPCNPIERAGMEGGRNWNYFLIVSSVVETMLTLNYSLATRPQRLLGIVCWKAVLSNATSKWSQQELDHSDHTFLGFQCFIISLLVLESVFLPIGRVRQKLWSKWELIKKSDLNCYWGKGMNFF